MVYVSNLAAGLEDGMDKPEFLLDCVKPYGGRVGIEFFVHSYWERYMKLLIKAPSWLGDLPRTTHGPFLGVEATSPEDSPEQQKLLDAYWWAFYVAKDLGSRHLVFHSNERFVRPEEKEELQARCLRNLSLLRQQARKACVILLVENLGLPVKGEPLFDEDEFIRLFASMPDVGCLIDIGHLYLAGWDMERVMTELSGRIVGYHLHNNNGQEDSHRRIGDGEADYEEFFRYYRRYTPKADLTLEYGDNHGITVREIHEDLDFVLSHTQERSTIL